MIWYVAVGGAIGTVGRYLLAVFVQSRWGASFPVGTLIINLTGSCLLGFLLRVMLGSSTVTPEVRAFMTTGLCGGYTTFSTFSYETAALLEGGQYGRAGLYVGLSIFGALLGTFTGIAAAQAVLNVREHL